MNQARHKPATVIFFFLVMAATQPSLATLELSASSATSTDGVVVLKWQGGGTANVTVQQAAQADFSDARVIYQGSDTASTLSGLRDGSYHFRVRSDAADPATAAWSDVVTVHVTHHSLSRAFGFFAIGVIVFCATLILIVTGARRYRDAT